MFPRNGRGITGSPDDFHDQPSGVALAVTQVFGCTESHPCRGCREHCGIEHVIGSRTVDRGQRAAAGEVRRPIRLVARGRRRCASTAGRGRHAGETRAPGGLRRSGAAGRGEWLHRPRRSWGAGRTTVSTGLCRRGCVWRRARWGSRARGGGRAEAQGTRWSDEGPAARAPSTSHRRGPASGRPMGMSTAIASMPSSSNRTTLRKSGCIETSTVWSSATATTQPPRQPSTPATRMRQPSLRQSSLRPNIDRQGSRFSIVMSSRRTRSNPSRDHLELELGLRFAAGRDDRVAVGLVAERSGDTE